MLRYPEIGLKLTLIILCISGLLYANSRSKGCSRFQDRWLKIQGR